MAKKKAAARKRKTAARKKKVEATKNSASTTETAPEEASDQEKPAAVKKATTTKRKTRRPAAKRKRITRSSAENKTPTGAQPAEPPTVKETTKKTKRRRSRSKGRSRPAAEGQQPPPDRSTRPSIVPVSAAAEVVQNDDTIVIRFPSASPVAASDSSVPSGEANEPEAASDVVPVDPPVDWEAKNDPESAVEEQEPSAASPRENGETPAPPAAQNGAATARPKRRRRRKRKDPRVLPEKEAVPDEEPGPQEGRQRPEPAVEVSEVAEPTVVEKPSRRRRRRSRRAQKPEALREPGAVEEQAAVEAPAKPERGAELANVSGPSGQKEMIINVVPQEECRIAIMENRKLEEIYLERASAENYVGNIYKGMVTNVEPSIQAAFVDFGQGKNGFLHISDLHPQYFPDGEGQTENVGRKMPRRSRPPIQRCLHRKQELLVQITKEGIGTKGPTLTSYLSIPGRFLVMMPGMRQLGVSRKIEDDDARRKLRDQLLELDLPANMGFIARTAALDRTKRELQSDLSYLSRLWKAVTDRIKTEKAPTEIYTESDLVIRTIRDVYTSDITRIVVDNPEVAERANEFLSIFSPRARDIVAKYVDPQPIFHRYGIEAELERLHSRHVPLKSGGSLVIDQTEALVAIDVNSGRFRTEDDAESTAFKIDLEAADEIARQLRLRDLGGVVICDFIDVRQESHKREIERRLNRNLKAHKERAKILRMSEFGIIELTRQRQRASLMRSVYKDCEACRGTGLVQTAESVVLDVMRRIQLAAARDNIRQIEVTVSAEVAHQLQNRKRKALHDLEATKKRAIVVRSDPNFGLDRIAMHCIDPRGRTVQHP